jgi:hypothetical protein
MTEFVSEEYRPLGWYAVWLLEGQTFQRNVAPPSSKIFRRVRRLLVTANVPNMLILVTLMMEALGSYEASVLRRATRRHIQEDCILHSHRRENLNSYIALTGWAL